MTLSIPQYFLTRALIVEDNALVSLNLSLMLEDIGFEVVKTTATVADALVNIEQHDFALAIIDIQLGQENGLVIADRCAAAKIPVILSTAHCKTMKNISKASEIILCKPYTFDDLHQAIIKISSAQPRDTP